MYQSKLIKINKPKNVSSVSDKSVNLEDALQAQKIKNKNLSDKYAKSQIKVKYLLDQLKQHGGLTQLPNTIEIDVLQIDSKIKQLQENLLFKRSKKMDQLREKVRFFLEIIKFDVDMQTLRQLKDQVQLILLLLQAFQVRYNQITSQHIQINQAVQNLKNSHAKNEIEENLSKAINQNQKLIRKIKQLQNELAHAKNNLGSIQRNNSNRALKTDRSQKTIDQLKTNIQRYEQKLSVQEVDLHKKNRKILECESQITLLRKRLQMAQQQQEKLHKDEVKWRQRYRLMQNQKNQRISILEQQLTKLKNYKSSKNKNILENSLQKDMNQSGTLYYDF